MKNIILISAFLLLISSCSRQKTSVAEKVLLPIDTMQCELGSPSLIKIVGNQLFVDRSFSTGYNIDVIDIKNDSLLYSFARQGQGAHEFLQITSMDAFEVGGRWYIALFDNLQRKLVTYSVDSLNCYNGKCLPINEKKMSNNTRFLEVYKTMDGYIATGRTEKKYTLLNENLTYNSSFGDYQTYNKDEDYMLLSKVNYGRLYLADDRCRMASVVFMSGMISVNEVNKVGLVNCWNYVASPFEYQVKGASVRQLSPTGYLAAGFMKDSVVGLYSGEEKKGNTNYGTSFHLFDSKGLLYEKYNITSRLYNFCISSETGLLYGISYKNDPKILVYKLN